MLYERMAIKHTKMKETFPHTALACFFILFLRWKRARRRGEAAKTKWRQKPPFFSRRGGGGATGNKWQRSATEKGGL
jgi:hypothetical protein